jgi:hypothetical protein
MGARPVALHLDTPRRAGLRQRWADDFGLAQAAGSAGTFAVLTFLRVPRGEL